MLRNLSKRAFGKCPITGNNGGEVASDDVSSSSDLNSSGNGIELVKFRGRYISQQAIDNILMREDSLRESRKHARSKSFRSKIGFRNSI